MARLIDADKLIYQSHAQHLEPYINKKDIDEAPTVEMAEDCVKREDAKGFLYERLDILNDDELYDIFSKIIDDMYNELPYVQPQPKRGKWIVIRKEYEFMGGVVNESQGCKCSNCGGVVKFKSDFCPNCGCRMDADIREAQDDGI